MFMLLWKVLAVGSWKGTVVADLKNQVAETSRVCGEVAKAAMRVDALEDNLFGLEKTILLKLGEMHPAPRPCPDLQKVYLEISNRLVAIEKDIKYIRGGKSL
jgi:hypothetical protein